MLVTSLGDIFGALMEKAPEPKGGDPYRAKEFLEDLLDDIRAIKEDHSGRHEDYIRGSGLYMTCGRREAILNVYPHLDRPDKIAPGQRLTFDVGHAQHEWWQNRYLGPMKRLWGSWYCIRCNTIVAEGLMPGKCPECLGGRKVLQFEEEQLLDPRLRYSGHPDGRLVDRDGNPRFLWELKTISSSGYEGLTSPKISHVIQVHAYMRLMGLKEAMIQYLDKGRQCEWSHTSLGLRAGKVRIKVFHVEFDPAFWAGVEQRIMDYWRARALMARDEIPVEADIATFQRVCAGPGARLAKDCSCRDKCFSLRVGK